MAGSISTLANTVILTSIVAFTLAGAPVEPILRIARRAWARLCQLRDREVHVLLGRYKQSQIVFAALDLGMFDLLSFRGPASAADLAEDMAGESPPSTGAIAALLEALVAQGLVVRSLPDSSGAGGGCLYANAPATSRLLCQASASNILAEAMLLQAEYPLWSELAEAVLACPEGVIAVPREAQSSDSPPPFRARDDPAPFLGIDEQPSAVPAHAASMSIERVMQIWVRHRQHLQVQQQNNDDGDDTDAET